MTHQVLSRKYRPQRFDECVGQDHVARIFQNALRSGRVGHAYLLVGPRGVGKTTTARIVARALNCAALGDLKGVEPATVEPCGQCDSCRDIAAGCDLDVVEMDAASNNAVDDVRALREQVGYATVRSRYRIWIVDEVHMLSLPAFNAFLKTLEEPPAQVKFLFCTTEEHKLPDTFRSRCQRVEFRPIDAGAMATRLEKLAEGEGVTLEEGVTLSIAQGALGGLRDAESQLEQLIAAREGDAAIGHAAIGQADLDALSGRASSALLGRLMEAVAAQDAAAALDAVDACLGAGSKPGVLVDQWLEALRVQMVAAVRDGGGYAKAARAIEVMLGKRAHLRAGADGGLVAQVAAVELARLPDARDLDALVQALQGQGGSAPEGGGSAPDGGAAAPARGAVAAEGGPPPEPPRGPIAAPPRAAPPSTPARRTAASASPPRFSTLVPEPAADGPNPETARHEAVKHETVDLETVRRRWQDLTQSGATRSPVLGRVLASVNPTSLDETTLYVALPADEAGPQGGGEARGTLQRREVQLALRQITKAVLGTALHVKIFESEDVPTGMDPIAHELLEHPAVRRVADLTGGRLLHVQRRADPQADAAGPQAEAAGPQAEAAGPQAEAAGTHEREARSDDA